MTPFIHQKNWMSLINQIFVAKVTVTTDTVAFLVSLIFWRLNNKNLSVVSPILGEVPYVQIRYYVITCLSPKSTGGGGVFPVRFVADNF